jgi:glutamate racemase
LSDRHEELVAAGHVFAHPTAMQADRRRAFPRRPGVSLSILERIQSRKSTGVIIGAGACGTTFSVTCEGYYEHIMIGIFDSGVGGMTVAHAIEMLLPSYRLVYFGDLARTPYGTKSPETIVRYSVQNAEFLLQQGAQVIIIACNSAASVATEELKKKFSVPIFEVISPAVAKAFRTSASGRIGVIGTTATVKSSIYRKKLRELAPDFRLFSQACPLLVPLVEEGWLRKRETKMIVRRYLHPLKQHQIDTLVLGCTHYPLLKDLIGPRIGTKVTLIDSSIEVAGAVKDFLALTPSVEKSLEQNGENLYYVSDMTSTAESIAAKIFGRRIRLIQQSWK